MGSNNTMLNTILDEIDSGFIIIKMVFGKKATPEDFTILEVNVPFEEITGLTLHHRIGSNYSDIHEDLDFLGFSWVAEYESLFGERKFRNREKYFEGRSLHLRIRTFIPQTGYLAIIVSDITSVKRLEKDSVSHEKRLMTFLENCRDGFLFFTSDEKITSCSSNISNLFDLNPEELRGSSDFSFLGSSDRQLMRESIQQVLIHPRLASEMEFQIEKKDGTRSWFEGTFHNMLQAKGVNSIVLRFKEITKRKKEELEFYQIASRLLSDYPI
jgi:PAS domain S-box-containing protein